jgi:hypothetical protein
MSNHCCSTTNIKEERRGFRWQAQRSASPAVPWQQARKILKHVITMHYLTLFSFSTHYTPLHYTGCHSHSSQLFLVKFHSKVIINMMMAVCLSTHTFCASSSLEVLPSVWSNYPNSLSHFSLYFWVFKSRFEFYLFKFFLNKIKNYNTPI